MNFDPKITRLLLEGVGLRFDRLWVDFRIAATQSGMNAVEAHHLYKQALAAEVRKVLVAEGVEVGS